MITPRKAADRGHFDFGWLDTHHTFSFGEYHDPRHMGFRSLRVINEDVVQGGEGFPTHPHRDMEIVTYVLEGALEHQDSTGGGGVIRPGDVQRMSAGRGIQHSEFNHSPTDRVHLLQIWLLPEQRGIAPGYEQKAVPLSERKDRLRVVAARDGRDGAVTIHADATLLSGVLDAGVRVEHALAPGRHAWVQVARGRVRLGDVELAAGDGAAVSNERRLALESLAPSEVLVFDLA
jgi:quercetin 2,3-dioxygenase